MPNNKFGNGNTPALILSGPSGQRIITDLANLIILYAATQTAARFTTYRRQNGSAGYAVTALKTLKIFAVQVKSVVAGLDYARNPILYGDTDVGLDAAAGPTNPIYVAGDANGWLAVMTHNTTVNQPDTLFCDFTVPAGKYPCAQGGGGIATTQFIAFGYET